MSFHKVSQRRSCGLNQIYFSSLPLPLSPLALPASPRKNSPSSSHNSSRFHTKLYRALNGIMTRRARVKLAFWRKKKYCKTPCVTMMHDFNIFLACRTGKTFFLQLSASPSCSLFYRLHPSVNICSPNLFMYEIIMVFFAMLIKYFSGYFFLEKFIFHRLVWGWKVFSAFIRALGCIWRFCNECSGNFGFEVSSF